MSVLVRKIFLVFSVIFICVSVLYGNETHDHDAHTQDSLTIAESAVQNDSTAVLNEKLTGNDENLTKANVDTHDIDETQTHSHTRLAIVRREHDYGRQAWLAVGMMTFVAIILATSQTWNPR